MPAKKFSKTGCKARPKTKPAKVPPAKASADVTPKVANTPMKTRM